MRLPCFARSDGDRRMILSGTIVCALLFMSWAHAQITITPTNTPPPQETVHRAKNLHNLTGEEKQHVPLLVIPTNIRPGKPFRMEIMVGQKLHPMTEEHHIEWIEVFVDDARVLHADFSAGQSVPDMAVSLILTKTSLIRVFAHCNTHGLWEGNLQVTVRQPTVIPKKTGKESTK